MWACRCPSLTFTARAPLYEDDASLPQPPGQAAHALQLAHVAVGDAVAAAHRAGGRAGADAACAASLHGGRRLRAEAQHALHPVRAPRAAEAPRAAARLPIAGRADRAAVAPVQRLSVGTVRGARGALREVAGLRTADDVTSADPRLDEQRGSDEEQVKKHDSVQMQVEKVPLYYRAVRRSGQGLGAGAAVELLWSDPEDLP